MFTLTTLFSEISPEFIKAGACEDAMKEFDGRHDLTAKEIIDGSREEWVMWCCYSLLDKFDEKAREYLLGAIKDSRRAINIYIDLNDLTDEEDTILKATFEGKEDGKETALDDGTIVREKPTTVVG